MRITRIDSNREISKKIQTIDIEIGADHYRLTEEHGMLHVHLSDEKIAVMPGCANEISIGKRIR